MQTLMLKAKLHRACVTHCELDYEGSCAIDEALLEAAGILEYEQIHIYDINNGERFVTYAIRGERDSGLISVNGAAAHKVAVGDLIIIAAYGQMDEAQARRFDPTLVYPDSDNRIMRISGQIPPQAA
ncbi:MAG: aspartate 1-decarboxylase [Wenzhouxiangella sp.]